VSRREGAAPRPEAEGPAAPAPGDGTRIATIPNVLSLLRLASVPLFVWLFVSGREEIAVVLYGVAASTDFFDGLVARRFDQVSEIGKLLDPLSDRVLIVALALALVARRVLPGWLAAAVIVRDLVLLSAFPLLERRGRGRIPVRRVGKAATAALFVGLTSLAVGETSFPPAAVAEEVGLPFVLLGAALYWVAGALYARDAHRLVRSPVAPVP
jgi:cardiolipin synthase (CMP-forming)